MSKIIIPECMSCAKKDAELAELKAELRHSHIMHAKTKNELTNVISERNKWFNEAESFVNKLAAETKRADVAERALSELRQVARTILREMRMVNIYKPILIGTITRDALDKLETLLEKP